ncbi:unnamed protein product [Spirodela intermedia]|uniref:Protein kinase domain-containing protein n=1 Tax=Spirodela intermedia TaxID=51605 RepID=A0A7I8IQF3_SPIIN|nr:unnamed protein product [Spirodela intermedia]CAA6660101.1 unnamed protein product [Spirodela intermedia]
MSLRPCFFLLLFFSSSVAVQVRLSAALSPDGLALLAFKFAVAADPGAALAAWDEGDADPCLWPGVSCAAVPSFSYPRVVAVSVPGKGLTGYIPSELGSLSFLRRLNLHSNSLSGFIPPQLSEATSLRALYLYSNNLSGPVPPSLCDLPRLQNLDLSGNALSGAIPARLGNCRQLKKLILSDNRLSGEVPAKIWPQLSGLMQLDLSRNNFSGPIPPDLGSLRSLSDPSGGRFVEPGVHRLPRQSQALRLAPPKPLQGPLRRSPTWHRSSPLSYSDQGEDQARRKRLKPGKIIIIAVADAVGVAVIGAVLVYAYWKLRLTSRGGCSCSRKTKLGREEAGGNEPCCLRCFCFSPPAAAPSEEGPNSDGAAAEEEEGHLVAVDKGFSFELDELLRASAYVLGKSSLGIVYKVVLRSGVPVTVRRLGEGGAQRRKEFAAEAQAIARVRHPNVVRLRAYYWSSDEKLLVSEFISNGSLAAALRGRSGQPAMPWATRMRIARGTAQGLAHIHECSSRKFVHGEIRPSNVLLDGEFNPHISDFGLRRLVHVAGVFDGGGAVLGRGNGYLPPEAQQAPVGKPTQKWDVYSFGLVLLELLTGRTPELSSPCRATTLSSRPPSMDPAELARWVRKSFEEERPLAELMDPALHREQEAKKEILSVFQLAMACTELNPESRPRMKTVSDFLENVGRR